MEQIDRDFLAMKDYQSALAETAELRDKIELAKVKIQYMDIQVQVLTDAAEMLVAKQDQLAEEKKLADYKNEDL